MRAPLSWLCDYAPFGGYPVERLTEAFSELGLVVDGVEQVGGDLPGVVVARILDIRAHPNADRIRLVDVDAGDGQPLQIACGAWNMEVGDLVPLATVGTVLPGGMKIGARQMKGQASNGMLCSAEEVELPQPPGDDGLLILPAGLAAPGTPLTEALDLRADVVFDLDITPNRPDALCMAGVARDLAAALGVTWTAPTGVPGGGDAAALPSIDLPSIDTVATVEVEAPDLCPRFTATVLVGVPRRASPPWLARRLTLAGMRPINLVVDVSNYVMLDVGQPNHAYDLDRLGGGGIVVRRAAAGETLVTLDGVTRTLGADDCLICDALGVPVGVGGIMGGSDSEISDSTATVLLEAAYFAPDAIARTGKRLGLGSEARTRFERGIDPEIAPAAAARFVTLLRAAGGVDADHLAAGPIVDRRSPSLDADATVTVRTGRVNAILGTELLDGEVAGLLAPIGFTASALAPGVHQVRIPSWRPDSRREIDVIEEVARLYGYRRIARTTPAGIRRGSGLTSYQRHRRHVRDVFAGAGLTEAWTTTFLAPGDLERAGLEAAAVEVENPLDRSESILRTALLPGLLKAVRFNVDRQTTAVRLFEIGRVFAPPAAGTVLPVEQELVAAVVAGPGADATVAARLWSTLAGALRLDGAGLAVPDGPEDLIAGLHPTRAARIVGAGGTVIGALGEVDPDVVGGYGLSGRVAFLTADLAGLADHPRRSAQAQPVSRFPASDVNLAFVVPATVPAAAVAATLAASGGDLVEAVRLFDVYRAPVLGADRRSLAFRLRLRAGDRTLGEAELAELRRQAVDAVVGAHRAELRG